MWNSIGIGHSNQSLINATRTYEAFNADIEKTEKGYSFDITLNENEIDSFETATLTVALYNDKNMLLDYVRVPVTSGIQTLTPIIETTKTPEYAKLMLWDSIDTLKPLCVEREIKIQ